MEKFYGYIAVARDIQHRAIYDKCLAWRAIYFHIRFNVNWEDNAPMPGLDKNQGLFDFSKVAPRLDHVKRGVWMRAIEWMRGTPDLSATDPQYIQPIIETRRTTRGLVITWVEPEAAQGGFMENKEAPELTPDAPPSKITWLTPFNDLWKAHCGGDLLFKRDCKAFSPLVKKHGADVVLQYWDNFLKSNAPMHCSVARFCSTFRTWSKIHAKRKDETQPIPEADRNIGLFDYETEGAKK